MAAEGSRTCTRCGREKPLEDFARNSSSSSGRKTICKECDSAWGAGWRAGRSEAGRRHDTIVKQAQRPTVLVHVDEGVQVRCASCGRTMALEEMDVDCRYQSGRSAWCRECADRLDREYEAEAMERDRPYRCRKCGGLYRWLEYDERLGMCYGCRHEMYARHRAERGGA